MFISRFLKIKEIQMMKLVLVGFIVLLTACATRGPSLMSPAISVDSSKLSDYWIKTKESTYNTSFPGKDKKCRTFSNEKPSNDTSFLMYSFLIDSKGETYQAKYHSKSENADIDLSVLNMMKNDNMVFTDNSTYSPAENNKMMIPVTLKAKKYIVACTVKKKA